MRNVFSIAGRELKASFITPLAYVVMAGFLLLSGFFFFSLLQQFNAIVYQAAMLPNIKPNLNEWVVTPFYQTLELVLVFLVPILTMRSFSEERRSGTFELLMTSPLSVGEIVWGKFLGITSVILLMLSLSFIFPLVLLIFSNPEVPPIFVGFFGLSLFAAGMTSLGIAASAFTRSQTIAGVSSLVGLLLLYVADAPAAKLGGLSERFLTYLAPSNHTQVLLKGVVDGVDVVYFISLIALGIFVSYRALDVARWR